MAGKPRFVISYRQHKIYKRSSCCVNRKRFPTQRRGLNVLFQPDNFYFAVMIFVSATTRAARRQVPYRAIRIDHAPPTTRQRYIAERQLRLNDSLFEFRLLGHKLQMAQAAIYQNFDAPLFDRVSPTAECMRASPAEHTRQAIYNFAAIYRSRNKYDGRRCRGDDGQYVQLRLNGMSHRRRPEAL